ncbi:MAG TPA: DUF3568 family protein [Planctomycetota bacterium]|nr:DUF3568 family protein [Planctomycetota bacterium]
MRKSLILTAALVLAAAACKSESGVFSERDFGTGANTVERTYAMPTDKVFDASLEAVKAMDLRVVEDRRDALGGRIVAERADGRKVTVSLRSPREKTTSVDVRVDPGDRPMAERIHESIADKAGLGKVSTGLFGDASRTATYDADVERARQAAERAARSLQLTAIRTEREGDTLWVDAREAATSQPVRFSVEKDASKVNVTFIADSGKDMADRMRAAFEKELRPLAD